MEKVKKRGLLFIALILFAAQFVLADNGTSSSYSIGSFHSGVSESNGSSSSYGGAETLTIFGGGNFTSSSYSGDSIWFPRIPVGGEETAAAAPSTATSTPGGGGAAGSASIIVRQVSDLEVVPDSFGITATVGRQAEAKLSVRNRGSKILAIDLSSSNLNEILSFSETQFSLAAGETKKLTIGIIPPPEPGIYTGKIILASEGKRFEIPFALNVNSELSLFDVSIDIADQYKVIKRGQNIRGQITLLQAGLQEKADVKVEYTIKDFEGNIYSTVSETVAVLGEKSYEYVFKTSSLPTGNYLIGVEVIYSGGVATASHQFQVASALFENTDIVILIIEAIIIVSILIILVIIARGYRGKKEI